MIPPCFYFLHLAAGRQGLRQMHACGFQPLSRAESLGRCARVFPFCVYYNHTRAGKARSKIARMACIYFQP